MPNSNYWIASISKDHVQKGRQTQILQVCHGKSGPLKRIKNGDLIAFYSGKKKMGEAKPYQKFTAIARAVDNEVCQVKQSEGFEPFRRKVEYLSCEEADIRPLINELDFIEDKKYWGYPFRFGLLKVSKRDFDLIAGQMKLNYE